MKTNEMPVNAESQIPAAVPPPAPVAPPPPPVASPVVSVTIPQPAVVAAKPKKGGKKNKAPVLATKI